MKITFYDWPYSPFCMKVRAILDYKGLQYERVNPIGHMRAIRRSGRIGKVPAVQIDGELIADSTDIAYALDERFPNPPLLPEDPRDRGLCHAIEDWADESLYFIGLYYRWYEREGRRPIPRAFGRSPVGRLAYWFYLRRILAQLRGQGTLRKPPEHVRRDLERHLDAIEALLTPGPYLLGGRHSGAHPLAQPRSQRGLLSGSPGQAARPYLCDFALWGQLNYLNRTPVGGQAIEQRAAIGEYLERISALSRNSTLETQAVPSD